MRVIARGAARTWLIVDAYRVSAYLVQSLWPSVLLPHEPSMLVMPNITDHPTLGVVCGVWKRGPPPPACFTDHTSRPTSVMANMTPVIRKGRCSLSGGTRISGMKAMYQMSVPMRSFVAMCDAKGIVFFMCANPGITAMHDEYNDNEGECTLTGTNG